MKWKLTLAALFLIGVSAGTLFYFKVLNPSHRNVAKEKPAFEMTANALYNAFDEDKDGATTKYLDQLILLSGKVAEKSTLADGRYKIEFQIEDMMGSVGADFSPEQNTLLKAVELGDIILCKAICTGVSGSDDEDELMAALGSQVQLKSGVLVK